MEIGLSVACRSWVKHDRQNCDIGVTVACHHNIGLAQSVVYNATTNTLPPNIASLGYQATQTSQFGDYVHLGGSDGLKDGHDHNERLGFISDSSSDPVIRQFVS